MKDYSVLVTNTNGSIFPNTEAVNASGPTATDGTEFIKAFIDDQWGHNQALMSDAGITPDGIQESAAASQRLTALKFIGYNQYTSGMALKAGTLLISPISNLRLVCIVMSSTFATNTGDALRDFANDIASGLIAPIQTGIVVDNATYTIGATGNFTTMQKCVDFFSMFKARNNKKVTCQMQAGFILAEQVSFIDIDLSFVEFSSVDATVTISRLALTVEQVTGYGYPAIFARGQKCDFGKISILFSMDATGTPTSRHGIQAYHGATGIISPAKGVLNAAHTAIYSIRGSSMICDSSNVTGAGIIGFAAEYADIQANSSISTGAGTYGYTARGGHIYAENATAGGGSFAYAPERGGYIVAYNPLGISTTSIPPNILNTSFGYISM